MAWNADSDSSFWLFFPLRIAYFWAFQTSVHNSSKIKKLRFWEVQNLALTFILILLCKYQNQNMMQFWFKFTIYKHKYGNLTISFEVWISILKHKTCSIKINIDIYTWLRYINNMLKLSILCKIQQETNKKLCSFCLLNIA